MRTRAAIVVVIALLLGACGRADRPSVEDWTTTWQTALAILPPPSFAADPDEATCGTVVGHLREISEVLLPTPDRALDTTIREWLEVAELTFFECPPKEGEIIGFDRAYAELDRIRAEVEAALVDGF